MPFRSFDSLYVFNVVASRMSFSLAADFLNLSKGAISYRISQLESELGFKLFYRRHTRITLTEKGERLWASSQNTIHQLEEAIENLRDDGRHSITLGTHTYFLSRWLAPRLTDFIQTHPNIAVRLEPINDLRDIQHREIDLAIFWGAGPWPDLSGKVFRKSACSPMASPALAERVAETGLAAAMKELPLLIDPIGEVAWRDWHDQAGLKFAPQVAPIQFTDGDSRVKAVIEGRGIALFDDLVEAERASGKIVRLSEIATTRHSYHLLSPPRSQTEAAPIKALWKWLYGQLGGDIPKIGT